MLGWLAVFSQWAIPLLLLVVLLAARRKRIPLYDTFIEGAKDGVNLVLRLAPYVIGIYAAVGMFRAAGGIDLLARWLQPVLSLLQIPVEVLPLMLVRPLSGPAALGLTADLFHRFGPDSLIGRMASIMEGSTDTTIYILAVYFAAVGVRRPRYALAVGLLADATGLLAAIVITHLLF